MPQSRTAMLAIILILALVSIATFAAYVREREKSPSVEIRLDQRGLKIDGR